MSKKKTQPEQELKTPMWIVLDGPDGSGKTTLLKHIGDYLDQKGYPNLLTKALGEGMLGKIIRKKFLNEKNPPGNEMTVAMLAMAIMETYHEYVKPSLSKKVSVVTDRWIGSMVAYQRFGDDNPHVSGALCHLGASPFRTDSKVVNPAIDRAPDLYFICDVDPKVAEERMQKRADEEALNRKDTESLDYKKTVRTAFNEVVPSYFDVKIIDCNQTLDTVKYEIEKHIDAFIYNRLLQRIKDNFAKKEDHGTCQVV